MTAPTEPSGIRFALDGIDEITFHKVLRDLMKDPAFARPLQVQAQPPTLRPPQDQEGGSYQPGTFQPGTLTYQPGTLTLVFGPSDRLLALAAMQRLKTIMLRYGVQIDSVWTPES